MKEILVKDVMIPIANYVTVKPENHLPGVLRAIEAKRMEEAGHAHRDAIVIDTDGRFVGKVTMLDVFRALDSGFRKIRDERGEKTLTDHFVQKAVRELNLWMDPLETVCQRGSRVTVAEAMHRPEDSEYIQEDDSLEKALSYYVMGVHQPLIVKKGDDVTGVLRFGDLFEVVHERLVACELT
ncbi:MAG: CBS domain-containing protein [Desulfobacterales bacterium]|nr:CBS domain-containing protein [Desulfobacterales bacterium]MDJ0855577.1 CBS domain-containing protein [Desulfobacterales bacterium]